jgi:hypothetical protein
MASKTVIIKPEFLNTTKRKTKRKLPEQVVIQPNNLREILLNKLIERRKTQKLKIDPPVLNEMFDRPAPLPPVNLGPVNLVVNSAVSQDKPYGILKNGTKPTFKAWTASEQSHVPVAKVEHHPITEPIAIIEPIANAEPIQDGPTKEKVVLGKNKKKKSVCVLIENNRTRKLHGERFQKIKKTSIQTVRNYLKNHNLIKSGSAAPNPLLRTLYENVLFCGDITNENKENLIHNFTDKVE